jgi:hypothetical protein
MFVSKQINHSFEATKKDLHKKGLSVSSGVSVKTSGRMTREDYIDSTQRAFINGMAVMKQAGSFGHADDIERPSPVTSDSPRGSPANSRQNSFAEGAPMTSRKNSLPVGTHAKAPASPQTNVGAFSRRSGSLTAGGSPIASVFGGKVVTPPSPPEEKKKMLGGLFKRRDSGKRGSTPQPI